MTIDATNLTFAADKPSRWQGGGNPGKVDTALNQIASKLYPETFETDNALVRVDIDGGGIQESSVLLGDGGAITNVVGITGASNQDFTIAAAGDGTNFTASRGTGCMEGPVNFKLRIRGGFTYSYVATL